MERVRDSEMNAIKRNSVQYGTQRYECVYSVNCIAYSLCSLFEQKGTKKQFDRGMVK